MRYEFQLMWVSVAAAARVGCVVHLIFGAVASFCYLALSANLFLESAILAPDLFNAVVGIGFLRIALCVPVQAAVGAIGWAVVAFVFNIAATVSGGLAVTLYRERPEPEKPKSRYEV
jgi:membrane protein implicated in regulation of membrane protease activity